MRWEDQVDRLLDDLEQQADGLALVERDALVAEQRPAEYAGVDLSARLHASLGAQVRLGVAGIGALDATLSRVGDGWVLLTSGAQDWIVRLAAVTTLRGLSVRAVGPAARPAPARLGLTSALRGVALARATVVVQCTDASTRRGLLGRVGADFVELAHAEAGSDAVDLVPFAALAAVRSG